MVHTALYRKYRPAVFADVQGQSHIVDVLESSIESGRIAHAYLFAGSRGTGKTSIARIFARALKTSDNDIYEIDAASNRGIDDIRAIRDGVSVLPLESTYKVYIIDEVHMLTKEAFNALLKTLEEPPKHVIFILATTELSKLPETVVSRCQVFTFKKPSREILRGVVSSVAKKEGFALEAGVADLIATLGDGSFRDTLGTLQKVVSSVAMPAGSGAEKSADKKTAAAKVTLAEAEQITGAPKNTVVNDFLEAVVKGDAPRALSAIAAASTSGVGISVFLSLVLEKARIVLLLKIAKPDIADLFSAEDAALLQALAAEPQSHLNAAALALLLRAYDETSRAYIPTLPLELAVVGIVGQNKAQAGA